MRSTASRDVHPQLDAKQELFCGECGYGVVVRGDPPQCPMCRAQAWSDRPNRARRD